MALSELGYTDAYVDAHHPTIAFEVTIEHSEGRGDLAQYRFALVGANGSEVVGAGSDGWISLDRARRYAASFSSSLKRGSRMATMIQDQMDKPRAGRMRTHEAVA